MKLYSTKNKSHLVSLREAVFKGLPDDNGLYMPVHIPLLPPDFIQQLPRYSFSDIAFTVAQSLLQGAIPETDLQRIIQNSITFPAPVVSLDARRHVLELFHGPSLAFKDFGARFMAQLMSYFNQAEQRELTILVATSGDTGGAVAAGFYKTPGIRVVILYPSGKVSFLQEKQLTTLDENITALEISGTFDDCQALVKKAFLDADLNQRQRLSSANSINIARLIPQSFYYFEAWKQLADKTIPMVFSVPSGNFGNLTAGLFAKKMGLPVHHFIAATNVNDVVPAYLASSEYRPRPSVRTLSNAMDVGNPSNFARMLDLYCSTWNIMRDEISGYGFNDDATEAAMREIKQRFGYVMDPHGAVGYLALEAYLRTHPQAQGVILETAHPAKFKEDVEKILGEPIDIPERLAVLSNKPKQATAMPNDFSVFKEWLMEF
ncbi:MAG TPA: threonine synthase [Saprospiraceae bacterium]|nr:threonine synthase [Saprospiraceae bacterium]HMP22516.1 threonine synthase [Saprospiraceae bacterium]